MKSNFKRNLLIGFSTSLIILIITSGASYISITNLLKSAKLVNHTNDVILAVNGARAAMVDAETGQRGYLLTGKEDFLNPYRDARERAQVWYDQAKRLTFDNPEQHENLQRLNDLMKERFKYLDLAIEQKRKNVVIPTSQLEQGREIMATVRQVIGDIEQIEKQLLQERTDTMNRFAAFTPPLIISAAMIALLITVLFYARIRGEFDERVKLQGELQKKDEETSTRIRIIESIANKISQGNYDVRVNDQQSDALGKVGGSLNKMAESLQYSFGLLSDKEWMQTGLSKLNDLMIGEKDEETLSKDVIEFLSAYSGGNAAAFYVLQRNELHAIAGYAFSPPKERQSIKLNDGILGQCIATRKPIELTEIPQESISISFATGEAKPRHVVAIPVLDGYLIKGAIELATISNFSPRQIEFLTNAAPNIGIALTTAQNRKRLQELLEETQAQSEELKSQHSELEGLNSELEIQSEKLQASEEELKVQQEELKQANQELEERSRLLEERNQMITERNFEIQSKADQLAQSTKYKSEFLANMSHELRTPLNSILLLSRLMSENPESNLTKDQIEYAKVIQSSGNGLLSLIDEILDLSKIEAGKMKLELQSIPLKEFVLDMHSMFDPVANEKNIEFKTSISHGVPETIETDKMRLHQIIRNLLSNAIKFTSTGYVELSIVPAEQKDFVKMIVRDSGIGIPKEKQTIIFEAFQQADGSTRRKYGGTGLGLSISRELTRLLGGEIALKSEAGHGAEFSITVPVSGNIKTAGEKPIPAAKPLHNGNSEKNSPKNNGSPSTSDAQKYISTQIPENIPDDRENIKVDEKSILIIEDDTNFAKALLDVTRRKGYKGIVAVRGDEGISLAKQFLPLGILLDIQLPVKSGWEVMDELKHSQDTRHIPVHIMSSHEVKGESLIKGAVDFISKPVAFDQMHEIFKKIEHVLTHHPKKVLIVEENPRHAKALAHFLETFSVNLEIENEVENAIQSLKQTETDCVILDMGIPDQKAYDTLEAVKRTPGLENLPIIIFTGKSLSPNEELKIKQYADSIVVKTAHSYKRILDEVSLFLHLMEKHRDKEKSPRYPKLGALDEVLRNKKVLVADDDMRNIFSLTKALEKYEMNVIAAVDGKDALQKLKESPDVDVVLMDMMMPEMDGYETTRAIRKDRRFKSLPIIAVTAKAMMGDREKCISAGASDYITKPVDPDQLFSLLRVWLYEGK